MKKRILISCITFLLLLAGGIGWWQYKVHNTRKLLLTADRLMIEHPDSALHLLRQIKIPERITNENQALYALLMTQAQYKNYLPIENDSLIRIAVDYYANEKDSLRKAWSCFYAAQVYRDTKDTKRSLSYFQKAATAAGGCNNYKLLFLLYCHWGRLLQDQKPYDEGLNKLLKAKEYVELNKDTVSLISTLGEIGWSYMYKKNYKEAQSYLWRGIELAQLLANQEKLSWLYHRLSTSYWADKDYSNALEYINASLRLDKDTNSIKPTLSLKSSIFIHLQQYDSAYYYNEKSESNDNNFYSKANYLLNLSRIEKGLGNYKEALEHHEIYSQYIDSIEISEKDDNLMELQKKYDYSIVQNENIHLKTKNQRRGIAILSISVILLIALFISYYIYNKVKQEKESKLREYLRKEEGLKEQIFKMNKVVKKIEGMNSLNSFQKKKANAELILSEKELEDLFSAINFCYDNFEKCLSTKYPNLTNDDIYMCCLLRMGVSNQNIAILLASNDEALKKRKYRIKREKMNITQEGISLEDFLKHF